MSVWSLADLDIGQAFLFVEGRLNTKNCNFSLQSGENSCEHEDFLLYY